MPTPSGHTSAILASKVQGKAVYNTKGEKIGHVEDIVLDKMSNNIEFAVLGFGGVLGMGEKFHPVPWALLDFNPDMGGYVVPLTKDIMQSAPVYRIEDLTKNDASIRTETFDYYKTPRYWE